MYVLQVYFKLQIPNKFFSLSLRYTKNTGKKKGLYTKQKEYHNRTTYFDLYYITSHFACFCQISCIFPMILLFIHQPYFNKTKCMHLPYSFHFFSKPPYEWSNSCCLPIFYPSVALNICVVCVVSSSFLGLKVCIWVKENKQVIFNLHFVVL